MTICIQPFLILTLNESQEKKVKLQLCQGSFIFSKATILGIQLSSILPLCWGKTQRTHSKESVLTLSQSILSLFFYARLFQPIFPHPVFQRRYFFFQLQSYHGQIYDCQSINTHKRILHIVQWPYLSTNIRGWL